MSLLKSFVLSVLALFVFTSIAFADKAGHTAVASKRAKHVRGHAVKVSGQTAKAVRGKKVEPEAAQAKAIVKVRKGAVKITGQKKHQRPTGAVLKEAPDGKAAKGRVGSVKDSEAGKRLRSGRKTVLSARVGKKAVSGLVAAAAVAGVAQTIKAEASSGDQPPAKSFVSPVAARQERYSAALNSKKALPTGSPEVPKKRLDLAHFKALADERARYTKAREPFDGRPIKIVIDPGHGGHDPGAIGAMGVKEKDVVLEIGRRLALRLESEAHMQVLMTRKDDVFIPLPERTSFANKAKADLFVSIHANASTDVATSGIETYYLDLAKTARAAGLAANENGMSLENISVLQAVLFDLMVNGNIKDSSQLAGDIQKSLVSRVRSKYEVKSHGVKQAPFYVLVGAQMPSVLVEVAYVSNKSEEERLGNSDYIDATVEGIYGGIVKYVKTKSIARQIDTTVSKK